MLWFKNAQVFCLNKEFDINKIIIDQIEIMAGFQPCLDCGYLFKAATKLYFQQNSFPEWGPAYYQLHKWINEYNGSGTNVFLHDALKLAGEMKHVR